MVVKAYYASEICNVAKAIAKGNHDPKVYEDFGDVKDVLKKLHEYGKIDLLCASPPCDKLSKINPKRENLKGKWKNIIAADP